MPTIDDALRELVARIYNDCIGAYGAGDGDPYQGQYEREIQKVVKAITEADDGNDSS
jgi:hypothetical protein